MAKTVLKLILFFLILNIYLAQEIPKEINSENHLRSLKPALFLNMSTTDLKLHTKILQTVYSESFSKNYYYTTLYVGPNRVKQTYVLDTGSSIMSSPCAPCEKCGPHKRNYYNSLLPKKSKPLKCDNKPCKLVPATNCKYKKDKEENKDLCSFDVKPETGDGISGYYLNDIVYFEADTNISSPFQRPTYRSYALPIGCTTGEYGKYKELKADGIIGLNNNEKSFISLLYNLKIINSDIFSLCFSLRGGYMSLGEVDTIYHKKNTIDYVPLLTSDEYYLIKIKGILIGDINNTIYSKSEAIIDTGNTISYFPNYLYKSIINEFNEYCIKQDGRCGNFKFEQELGYCATFEDRESLFKAIHNYWPNITLQLSKQKIYYWKPIHYYYYFFEKDKGIRRACLGFNSHKSQNIILGTNFIHGHDIIFDRANKLLGFVPADCSRGNKILKRFGSLYRNHLFFNRNDPNFLDKAIHRSEIEGNFNFGDNNTKDMLDFIQGHNTELDFNSDFKLVNFIILLSSIIVVVVVFAIVIWALMCNKRGYLKYDNPKAGQYMEEVNDENTSNKISFE